MKVELEQFGQGVLKEKKMNSLNLRAMDKEYDKF